MAPIIRYTAAMLPQMTVGVLDIGSTGIRVKVLKISDAENGSGLSVSEQCHVSVKTALSECPLKQIGAEIQLALESLRQKNDACSAEALRDAHFTFGATAGFRKLRAHEQSQRMERISDAISHSRVFRPDRVYSGRVLTGFEEGLLTFFSSNYGVLFGSRDGRRDVKVAKLRRTIEIGGQSMQTAFVNSSCSNIPRTDSKSGRKATKCYKIMPFFGAARNGSGASITVEVNSFEDLGVNRFKNGRKVIKAACKFSFRNPRGRLTVGDEQKNDTIYRCSESTKSELKAALLKTPFALGDDEGEIEVLGAPYYLMMRQGTTRSQSTGIGPKAAADGKIEMEELRSKVDDKCSQSAAGDTLADIEDGCFSGVYVGSLLTTLRAFEKHSVYTKSVSWEVGAAIQLYYHVAKSNSSIIKPQLGDASMQGDGWLGSFPIQRSDVVSDTPADAMRSVLLPEIIVVVLFALAVGRCLVRARIKFYKPWNAAGNYEYARFIENA